MAWFVIECERKTWIKYIVKATSKRAALEGSNRQYLGYVDEDTSRRPRVAGPFTRKSKALKDPSGYVEGR
jgi:hypothetical protein